MIVYAVFCAVKIDWRPPFIQVKNKGIQKKISFFPIKSGISIVQHLRPVLSQLGIDKRNIYADPRWSGYRYIKLAYFLERS